MLSGPCRSLLKRSGTVSNLDYSRVIPINGRALQIEDNGCVLFRMEQGARSHFEHPVTCFYRLAFCYFRLTRRSTNCGGLPPKQRIVNFRGIAPWIGSTRVYAAKPSNAAALPPKIFCLSSSEIFSAWTTSTERLRAMGTGGESLPKTT